VGYRGLTPYLEIWRPRAHGRRLGVYRHAIALLRYYSGALQADSSVDWARVRRVVFVCTGNICRSAYGEAAARARGIPVASFGLKATLGTPADAVATEVAAERGLSLAAHRSRRPEDVARQVGDLLVAFEPWQAEMLRAGQTLDSQVVLCGLLVRPVRPHIEDPFGLSRHYFGVCFDVIDSALDAVEAQLRDGIAP
jgi:protein-tyrosine phosphatase